MFDWMTGELYEEVFEHVLENTSFNQKDIPDFDLEVAGFVSYERDCVLKMQRDELDEVSLEYGKGFQECTTESGHRYMRVVDAMGVRQVDSFEEASKFLEPAGNNQKIPSTKKQRL